MNQTMYVFDVDGVLCDIGSPELDRRVIKELTALLAAGSFVAVNTGRDLTGSAVNSLHHS